MIFSRFPRVLLFARSFVGTFFPFEDGIISVFLTFLLFPPHLWSPQSPSEEFFIAWKHQLYIIRNSPGQHRNFGNLVATPVSLFVTTLVVVEAAPHRHTSRLSSASTLLGLIYQASIQNRSSIHFISLSGFRGWQKHSLGHPGTWVGLLIKVSFASSNHRGVLNTTPRVKCWLCLLERKAVKQERHPTEMKAKLTNDSISKTNHWAWMLWDEK